METDRTLDSEGVPDLEGPLPEKTATGDPQEGLPPPNDRPQASLDWGTTAEEQRLGEPDDLRLAREVPDPTADPETVAHSGDIDPEEIVDVADRDPEDLDAEVYESGPELGRSAEEAALHVTEPD
jgi:hypothetical protein